MVSTFFDEKWTTITKNVAKMRNISAYIILGYFLIFGDVSETSG
jgi:hypothetical protein